MSLIYKLVKYRLQNMRKIAVSLLGMCLTLAVYGQDQKWTEVPLTDLSSFQSQAGNWSIVGSVMMNPTIDIHHTPSPPEPAIVETTKKKRKKRKKAVTPPPAPPPMPKAVEFMAGTGILINNNNPTQKDHLLTKWEHGDILLELEVMIPKGSNSGIYLQGRYEVQLLDSWGKNQPSFSDIGGIYRNWEEEKGHIYSGKAPLSNAAKAAGLWQKFVIAFKAPQFDANGKKIANAKFVYVDLNGIRIHENVEVPLPTGGPIDKQEVAMGPLMIQGDHGPVAFRNIKYQSLQANDLELTDISYQYYAGRQSNLDGLYKIEGERKGALEVLTTDIGKLAEHYAITYEGSLIAPEKKQYPIRLNFRGSIRLRVGNKVISSDHQGNGRKTFKVNLDKGANDFELTYYKDEAWWEPQLAMFDIGSFPNPVKGSSTLPTNSRRTGPIYVDVQRKARLLRAFLDFNGNSKDRLTHTLGVGTPEGTHYIYDLKTGSIACTWRGDFIDATPMWNNRGDGSFRPRGATNYLFMGHSFAFLSSADAPFPSLLSETDGFKNLGYQVDAKSGLPSFHFKLDTLDLQDQIQLAMEGNALQRTISLTNAEQASDLYIKLAEGSIIEKVEAGIYVVDQRYYIHTSTTDTIQVRETAGKKELVSTMAGKSFTYTINW